jgi:hypothetical protein
MDIPPEFTLHLTANQRYYLLSIIKEDLSAAHNDLTNPDPEFVRQAIKDLGFAIRLLEGLREGG